MTNHITIEERLEIFAEAGLTSGFSLNIWDSKANALEKQGIILRNPKPTGRKGENRYEVDFSLPVPGSFSEMLFNIAMKNRSEKDNRPTEPLHPPYNSD